MNISATIYEERNQHLPERAPISKTPTSSPPLTSRWVRLAFGRARRSSVVGRSAFPGSPRGHGSRDLFAKSAPLLLPNQKQSSSRSHEDVMHAFCGCRVRNWDLPCRCISSQAICFIEDINFSCFLRWCCIPLLKPGCSLTDIRPLQNVQLRWVATFAGLPRSQPSDVT